VTPEERPFRFGVLLDTRGGTPAGTAELARRAEAADVDVLLGTDHVGRRAALPLLQAAASVSRLRIGTYVLNNDFRHPVLLAQDLATLDIVTDGRVEIGLGAGWNRPEYDAIALPFDAPGVRVGRVEASVRILKAAMRDGRVERGADAAYPAISAGDLPRSAQRPHPPFLVGGGGPRLLRFAAREAQIVALNPRSLPEGRLDPADVTAAAVDRKIGWVRDAAGERWAELEINAILFDVDPDFGRRSGPPPPRTHGASEDIMAASPHYLVGDVDEMAEQVLEARRRWGISYLSMRPAHLDAMEPVIRRVRDLA
jgi:probable F420-dependent oxidoreductase